MSVLGGIVGGVKSLFGKGSLVTLIDVDDKAERRAAEGARWLCLLLGAAGAVYLVLAAVSKLISVLKG